MALAAQRYIVKILIKLFKSEHSCPLSVSADRFSVGKSHFYFYFATSHKNLQSNDVITVFSIGSPDTYLIQS